jgi:uncharacterized small protein (DUF1192 family)
MAWLKKKSDPLSARARALNAEIAALQVEIQRLDAKLQHGGAPRLRSTALPHGPTVAHAAAARSAPPSSPEPIFEDVDRGRLKARFESGGTPDHYNELGVRKYDLPALLGRLRSCFRGPSATNPKLISYLAAGGVQGLRPLRYERRVARNRFIALVTVLFLVLLGLISVFLRQH